MLQRRLAFVVLLVLMNVACFAQTPTGTIIGTVRDGGGHALEQVSVSVEGGTSGEHTDAKGKYKIVVEAGKQLTIVFSYLGNEPIKRLMNVPPGEKMKLDVVLQGKSYQIDSVVKRDVRHTDPGSVSLDFKQGSQFVGTNDPIYGMIRSMVGGNRDEMSNQYSVRGGNYDENLVYVNDFEIYRPYLVRSGQQEGIGFVNADLVSNVNFSLGGFQAKYGDKMSSVLDVGYRRPDHFAGTVNLSLLGAGLSLEGTALNKKLTYMIGLRQKSNQYLLQSQPTKGVYNPSFTDVQALVNYRINDRWEVEAIGNYSRNRFSFYPETSTSTFGLVSEAYQLNIFYTGSEIDQFDSRFGGISATYRPSSRLKLKLLASGFQTNEQETYDISGEYLLGLLETDLGKADFGQVKTSLGTGIIQTHARNYLQVNVGTLAHRGSYSAGKHYISWGLDASVSHINDQLHEWERRDSAGFTQPYSPDLLVMKYLYDSKATIDYVRYSGFLQDNFRLDSAGRVNLSLGVRFNYSDLNKEFILSPRGQLTIRPRWKRDVLFKFAAGMYAQPAFYREMRDLEGNLNTQVRAQKSFHYVAGTEQNFKWGNRPLKFTTEVYYKQMWDLVPYQYDDVRIRYFGRNDAVGYAYGGELRLYGELVKDATSWVSLGLMKTSENLNDDEIVYKSQAGGDSAIVHPGYIPRPLDQRVMLGLYLQDYLPRHKNFKVHLNLLYATGLPFGPPNGQRYADTLRLPDYKRVDIGFSALLLDGLKKDKKKSSMFKNIQSIWLSFEVFNLLGIQNTISYTWVTDQTSGKTFAVPNRLTSRLLNLKLIVKF